MRLTLLDDRLDDALPHAAHGAEPIADGLVVIDRELEARQVHVRRLHFEAAANRGSRGSA